MRWLDRFLNGKPLDQINRALVDRITQIKLDEEVSNATANRVLEVLRAVLRRAVNEWDQSDLVTNSDLRSTGITFEVDILNDATSDLAIKLQLTESVVVSLDASGHHSITHIDDSIPLWTAP